MGPAMVVNWGNQPFAALIWAVGLSLALVLHILWAIGGLLGYGAITGLVLSCWWPFCLPMVFAIEMGVRAPNSELLTWMWAFGWLGVLEAPMLLSSFIYLIAT